MVYCTPLLLPGSIDVESFLIHLFTLGTVKVETFVTSVAELLHLGRTSIFFHLSFFPAILAQKKGSNLLKMYMFRLANLRVLGFQLMSSVEKSGQFECIAKIGLQASVRVAAEIISMRKTLIVVVHKCELKAVQCHNDLRVFYNTLAKGLA